MNLGSGIKFSVVCITSVVDVPVIVLGCYVDQETRDLPSPVLYNNAMTQVYCRRHCFEQVTSLTNNILHLDKSDPNPNLRENVNRFIVTVAEYSFMVSCVILVPT